MSPPSKTATACARYDRALSHARLLNLPPGALRPLPTCYWPEKNKQLLEQFYAWLLSGGTSERTANLIYLPIAGHALGLSLQPRERLDPDPRLDRALEYLRARGVSEHWFKACRAGLHKFRRFLLSAGGPEQIQKQAHYDIPAHTRGLPERLVQELENFQRVQQRNWRPERTARNIRRFWSTHLPVWRFLCEQRGVRHLADLERQHLLDYIEQRLDAGYALSGVNLQIRVFRAFMRFLKQQGYPVLGALLRIPALKLPETLPRYLTDEQVEKLQQHFEGRVSQAKLSHKRRDALLDRAIFYLLWQGGMRLGEVEELRLGDLDLPDRRLVVRNGKGLKDRTVFLNDRVVLTLREYLAVRGMGAGDHVFLYRNAQLKKDLIRNRLKLAGNRVGVKVYPHRLRHTCATQLLNAGCRVTSIQRFLGHKSLSSTMIYAHAHDQTIADDYFAAMSRVEQRLDIVPEPKQETSDEVVNVLPTAQLMVWVERLALPELCQEERLEIADSLKQALFLNIASQHAPPVVFAELVQ